jgi:hypothetical protein
VSIKSTIELTGFRPQHLCAMASNQEARETLYRLPHWLSLVTRWSATPAYTLWHDAEPLVCFGMLLPYAKLGEIWAVFSEQAPQYTRRILETTRLCLDLVIQKYRLRRVQGTARKRCPQARRFLRALGMQQYGVWPQSGPFGETMVAYVLYPG